MSQSKSNIKIYKLFISFMQGSYAFSSTNTRKVNAKRKRMLKLNGKKSSTVPLLYYRYKFLILQRLS